MNERPHETEPSKDELSDEEFFQNYIKDLALSPEDLSKTILDVGSGSNQFAKWAKEHNLSYSIYGLEPKLEPLEKTKSVKGKAEAIPFKKESFDLVVSDAAIPNIFIGEGSVTLIEKIRTGLMECMRVTRPGGEIRLGRVLRGKLYESQRELMAALDVILEELLVSYGAEIEEIPFPAADTHEYVNEKPVKVLARAYLIRIRKPI